MRLPPARCSLCAGRLCCRPFPQRPALIVRSLQSAASSLPLPARLQRDSSETQASGGVARESQARREGARTAACAMRAAQLRAALPCARLSGIKTQYSAEKDAFFPRVPQVFSASFLNRGFRAPPRSLTRPRPLAARGRSSVFVCVGRGPMGAGRSELAAELGQWQAHSLLSTKGGPEPSGAPASPSRRTGPSGRGRARLVCGPRASCGPAWAPVTSGGNGAPLVRSGRPVRRRATAARPARAVIARPAAGWTRTVAPLAPGRAADCVWGGGGSI